MTEGLAGHVSPGPTCPLSDEALLGLYDAQEGDSSIESRTECVRNIVVVAIAAERARLWEALKTGVERQRFDIACREVDERGALPRDITATERYERMARAFESETGYMAPGKSVPPEMAYTIMQDAERSAHWKTFVAGCRACEQHAREVPNG